MRCARCDGSGVMTCTPRCNTCRGRGELLDPLEVVEAEFLDRSNGSSAKIEHGHSPATVALLLCTLLSYAAEGFFPEYRYHFWLYGRQAVEQGQWWQFVTSLFLHADLLQLCFNMAALYLLGPPLEETIGSVRFGLLYVLSGIAGNLTSVAIHPRIQTVGASGCLFGVAGAWIGLYLRERTFSPRIIAVLSVYAALMLSVGFLPDTGLNNLAHLGGFLFGFSASLLTGSRPDLHHD